MQQKKTDFIKAKGLRTIEQYPKVNLVHAYTVGSTDETITNGGSGVILVTPSDTVQQRKICAEAVASNCTCELLAIVGELDQYKTLPAFEQAEDLDVFCDSRAALQAILKKFLDH